MTGMAIPTACDRIDRAGCPGADPLPLRDVGRGPAVYVTERAREVLSLLNRLFDEASAQQVGADANELPEVPAARPTAAARCRS